MTTDEKLAWLAGQVDAIKPFILASIHSQQDVSMLAREFEKTSELQLGQLLPQKISEHYVQGLQSMIADIRAFLEPSKEL